MMLTSAETVIVPPTVDPDVGDVTVTIRLPTGSWAKAGGGTMKAQPKTTRRAAT
jgi:hypothetical protein